MGDPERAERVLANERLFGAAGERSGRAADTDLYLCECTASDCTGRVALTHDEYAEARREPTRFLMLAGHRDPAHERVVHETARYVLAEPV